MAVTATELKQRLVEFALVSATTVQAAIDEAERRTNRDTWAGKADDAVTYLAAHLLKMDLDGSSAAPGPVSAESAGPVSVTYSVPTAFAQDDLGRTVYGQRYLGLQKSLYPARVF